MVHRGQNPTVQEKTHRGAVPAHNQPIAVVLDLMHPVETGRRLVGKRRDAWGDKAIGTKAGARHAPEIAARHRPVESPECRGSRKFPEKLGHLDEDPLTNQRKSEPHRWARRKPRAHASRRQDLTRPLMIVRPAWPNASASSRKPNFCWPTRRRSSCTSLASSSSVPIFAQRASIL
jgi:hypothetical protein